MGIFKEMVEIKKREIEVKQGKHGIFKKYAILIPLLLLYWAKALFMPGREFYLVLLIPITIIFIFSIAKDLKNRNSEENTQPAEKQSGLAVSKEEKEEVMVRKKMVRKKSVKNYITPSGRGTRGEFWMMLIINFTIFIIISFLLAICGIIFDVSDTVVGNIELLSFYGFIYLILATMARRLHDINLSGWWALLLFIPVVGWVTLFVLILFPSREAKKNNLSTTKKILKITLILAGLVWGIFMMATLTIGIVERAVNRDNINSNQESENGNITISQDGNTVNFESAGNLGVTHKLKCLKGDEVKPEYTPADLMPAVVDCIDKERYEDGAMIFLTASLYGSYDKQRVKDVTAHQAISALIAKHIQFLDTPNKEKYNALMKNLLEELDDGENNSPLENKFCNFIIKLPKPNYFPSYMINHGMDAFSADFDEKKGLSDNYNSDEIWQKVLQKNWDACYKELK
jgi:uncharacterized membrane protein YhaH (DUF805 family)